MSGRASSIWATHLEPSSRTSRRDAVRGTFDRRDDPGSDRTHLAHAPVRGRRRDRFRRAPARRYDADSPGARRRRSRIAPGECCSTRADSTGLASGALCGDSVPLVHRRGARSDRCRGRSVVLQRLLGQRPPLCRDDVRRSGEYRESDDAAGQTGYGHSRSGSLGGTSLSL